MDCEIAPDFQIALTRQRILQYIFESSNEAVLNVFMVRFPELRRDIDIMAFPMGTHAENMRRRALYRFWYEPGAGIAT